MAPDWRHLGPPPGELVPLGAIITREKENRSDGGSIVKLSNGRLRMYLQGLGYRLTALEAEQPEGPWNFVRDEMYDRFELAPAHFGHQWLFPHVSSMGKHGFLC